MEALWLMSVCLSLYLSGSSLFPPPDTTFQMIGPAWDRCPLWFSELRTEVRFTWYKMAAVARPSLSSLMGDGAFAVA